jgi:hypothetical protein
MYLNAKINTMPGVDNFTEKQERAKTLCKVEKIRSK